mgnify:CR=1 FL=1
MNEFKKGLKDGIPIALGYLSVSFSIGIMVLTGGLSVFQGALMSLTNVTSAGQFAGLTIIGAGGSLVEMALSQLVINMRYALMSLALGPRFGPSVSTWKRLLCAFFNTDEVFALGMARGQKLTASYFLGAGTVAAIGWIGGTALGAVAGSLLPESVRMAMSTLLYGMFVAIVIPQARAEKPMAVCLALALVFSCLFTWLPLLNTVSTGLAIVICTVAAAALCAVLFPVKEDAQ